MSLSARRHRPRLDRCSDKIDDLPQPDEWDDSWDGLDDIHDERRMNVGEVDVLKEVVEALLRERDFLGYQLSYANGLMTDCEMEEINKHLVPEQSSVTGELIAKVEVLYKLMPDKVDADVVSTVFNCDLPTAVKVLKPLRERSLVYNLTSQ
ncbi:MAG: hypothetical protein ACXABY_19180 [Candidatus Thorarchaeota archaeon]|jgi:hypothetical protein